MMLRLEDNFLAFSMLAFVTSGESGLGIRVTIAAVFTSYGLSAVPVFASTSNK